MNAPEVIIPPEHQSAPKEHWIAEEMRKAAEDIDQGNFTPQLEDDEYFYTGPEQLFFKHPRLRDAMERLKTESDQAKNTQEAIEKQQMLHELNERINATNRWDGQGRWQGAENEEMRQGELLEPLEFMRRLWAVVGENRVQINRFAILGRVALLVDDPEAETRRMYAEQLFDFDRQVLDLERETNGESFGVKLKKLEARVTAAEKARPSIPSEFKNKAQVATLQYPLGTEWMLMRFDAYGVPTTAKFLGWRTALLSLITLNIITEKEAHKAFPVTHNEASLWYRAQLYYLRNRGGTA